MNTTQTTMLIKTDKALKIKAQKLAREMGLPLSTLVNNYLKTFVIDRQVVFTAPMPNQKTIKAIQESRKEFKDGKTSGPFKTVGDMMKSLNS